MTEPVVPGQAILTSPPLSELDEHRIRHAVNESLDKWRTKNIALGTFLVVAYGMVSALVLWSVQSSGRLAGESAAQAAVEGKIKPERETISKLVVETSENHAKAKVFADQTSEIHRKAVALETQVKVTLEGLERANRVVASNYDAIATKLATDETFKLGVAAVANQQLTDARETITRMSSDLTALRAEIKSLRTATQFISTVDKETHVKGPLHVYDDGSNGHVVIWNYDHSGIQSFGKDGKPNTLELFNFIKK